MTQESFFEYMTNIFEPWLNLNKITRPVIFFMDGHISHLSFHLSQFCSEKQIVLVALLPNATHLLLPMDVAVFHTLKVSWRQKVADWRIANEGAQLTKQVFPGILKSVLDVLP